MKNYLSDMALFVEVVKAKGFRKAAEITGVPGSTLSRRISVLEKSTGLRLLNRTTRKIELTEAGQVYFDRCKRIVNEAQLAHEQLGSILAKPSGILRVSLPVDFAIIYLAPLVTEFAELYPGITFDFDLTPRKADLISDPSDIAIRMGEPENSLLIARRIATLTAKLYTSPEYIQRSGMPESPADLQHHECLGMLKTRTWTLCSPTKKETVPVSGRFSLNNVGMIKRLVVLGQGIMLVPEEVVSDELTSGKIIPILPEWHSIPQPVYALTETRLIPAKTQKFIDFIKLRLSQKTHPDR
ncbi:LysR family transcriptional regulator [Tatumella sp. JGM100]|nr:LysR family transcriptional regulator [Tatumella sp. JGM16]MBS0878423.1 LysR family transcriptional regulator [Tatumella sp. JGM82]MBS0891999.1 LysR family transcriptional regulator [Tatumella sp. JGM94]MBS0892953.1 LysR family transcriptional regulator [Tatumella sp. JGM130]MBS0903117.1 LysR family transcriptional regulator [Tatumella sp. JGM100]MBS0913888.1 LysR family transcriptional regulator [Tatumella sp. JGM91]